MPQRVKVLLDEKEAVEFRSQAARESKSLSAWLRDAGKKMLDERRKRSPLSDSESLMKFFNSCNEREKGIEPEWQEHKRLILEGSRKDNRP